MQREDKRRWLHTKSNPAEKTSRKEDDFQFSRHHVQRQIPRQAARCSREDTDKNDGLHVANVLAASTVVFCTSNFQLCFHQEEEKSVPKNMDSTSIVACTLEDKETLRPLHQETENSLPSVKGPLACAKTRCAWRARSTETRNQY